MNRRTFIRVSTSGGLLILSGLPFQSCQEEDGRAFEPWSGPSPLLDDEDVRLRIISYALLAPSFKNTQPWWVDIKGDAIDIRPEMHRIPTVLDPTGRQTMISLGTFIETLSVAASSFGYSLDARMFPDGYTGTGLGENIRIASCLLTASTDGTTDPLFNAILRRRTNRTRFQDKLLESKHVDELHNTVIPSSVSLSIVTDSSDVDTISDLARVAAEDEYRSQKTRDAAAAYLRSSAKEVQRTRDGMLMENMGFSPARRIWIQLLSGFAGDPAASILDALPDVISGQTGSAAAYGVLLTPGDSPEERVAAGRAFMRVHLRSTELGVAFQPFSRILETEAGEDDMTSAVNPNGKRIQSLFRLGYAADVPPTPRRSLFEIVRI